MPLALLALAAAAIAIIVVLPPAPASAQSGGMMLDTPGDEQNGGSEVVRALRDNWWRQVRFPRLRQDEPGSSRVLSFAQIDTKIGTGIYPLDLEHD